MDEERIDFQMSVFTVDVNAFQWSGGKVLMVLVAIPEDTG